MQRWSDGLGRTIIIAGIAGSLFAGFLALAPRLTASNATPAPGTPSPTAPLAESISLPSISDPVIAVPADPVDAVDPVETTATAPADSATNGTMTIDTPLIAMATSSTTSTIAETPTTMLPALDGSITLTIERRVAGDSESAETFLEGEEIEWRFVVTNTSGEELWGTYAYLERHGEVPCDATNLQPGESTDCWIVTVAEEGIHTAEAWATAWTTDRLVAVEIDSTFEVTG